MPADSSGQLDLLRDLRANRVVELNCTVQTEPAASRQLADAGLRPEVEFFLVKTAYVYLLQPNPAEEGA